MKRIILIALVAFAYTTGSAQIKTEAGTFTKPVARTTIFEVSMTPDIIGGGIFSLPTLNSDLGMVGVKIRGFKNETKGYRYGATLAILDTGEDHRDTDFAIGLSAGIEHHRKGAERLSTYWGYEANVGYVTTSERDHYGYGDDALYYEPRFEQTKKFGAGASVFTGFDYYIMPKIYLGTEISYSIAVTSTDREHGDNITRLALSPGITPSLRLGWQF